MCPSQITRRKTSFLEPAAKPRSLCHPVPAVGQITIPAEVRNALKLDTGDRIAFEVAEPGCYVFKRVQKVPVTGRYGFDSAH